MTLYITPRRHEHEADLAVSEILLDLRPEITVASNPWSNSASNVSAVRPSPAQRSSSQADSFAALHSPAALAGEGVRDKLGSFLGADQTPTETPTPAESVPRGK